jgi:hypothetical protein
MREWALFQIHPHQGQEDLVLGGRCGGSNSSEVAPSPVELEAHLDLAAAEAMQLDPIRHGF